MGPAGAKGGAEGSYLQMGPGGAKAAPADGGSYLEMGPGGIQDTYLEMTPDAVISEDMGVDGYLKLQANQASEDSGYLAVDPDWLADQWDLLSEQKWFRGFQGRQEAKDELAGKPPGSFITRVSASQPGHFALSVIQKNGHFDHMLILPSYAGKEAGAPGNTRYRLGTYSRLLFNTIPKLVAYYIGHPYIDDLHLNGDVAPEKQEGGYMMVDPDDGGFKDAEDEYE
jgi:hypothetical protein